MPPRRAAELQRAFPLAQQFHERRIRADFWPLTADKLDRLIARPLVLVHQIGGHHHTAAAHPLPAMDERSFARLPLRFDKRHLLAQPVDARRRSTIPDWVPYMYLALVTVLRFAEIE